MKIFCVFTTVLLFLVQDCFSQDLLHRRMDSVAGRITGHLGVYAQVIETGEHFSYQGDLHFPMQSVYKFPIAMAVLDAVDRGLLRLDQVVSIRKDEYIVVGRSPIRDEHPSGVDISIRDLIRYSVGESDGSASDAQCKVLGGIQAADAYVHRLGVKDMHIAILERVQVTHDLIQYKNWATPKATTELLSLLYRGSGLKDSSRAFLLDVMAASTPGARRLKGLLPAGTIVAHKTGTSGTMEDKSVPGGTHAGLTRATNDAGIISLPNGRHLAITVYISDSHSSEDARELAIAQVAKVLFDHYKY